MNTQSDRAPSQQKPTTFPGSVKQVYGYGSPIPTQPSFDPSQQSKPADEKFRNYENSVSDVWDAGVSLDDSLANYTAAKVLERHAKNQPALYPSPYIGIANRVMPNCKPPPSKGMVEKGMQLLATQQQQQPPSVPLTQSNLAHSSVTTNIYPRLSRISSTNCDLSEADISRFDRIRRILGICNEEETEPTHNNVVVDLNELRKECWLGIPHRLRPLAWRVLIGYIPTNFDRRVYTLKRKREEYWNFVEQYFHTRYDEQHQTTFRQIHIDIPRMSPLIPLFQQKLVQEIFERILYIWAIRHPASGYVQGINDLVTPFFVVFLSEFISDGVEIGNFDVTQLDRRKIEIVEADSFWCVNTLLDTIQDNYTFAQPGIQRKVNELKELISRVDGKLLSHFDAHGVEFLQFAFRWMNNLLMREIPLRATIRLWDTYLSEPNGFSIYHTYICVAFLRHWSDQLRDEKDFQGIMLLLQNLPTQSWADKQISELSAVAYSLMQVFHGSRIN